MADTGDFTELRDRAHQRLTDSGGSCPAPEMERAVFGARGGGLWSRLLEQALGGDARFSLEDGVWSLRPDCTRETLSPHAVPAMPPAVAAPTAPARAATHAAALDELPSRSLSPDGRYVVLDVEATGARPERHRVTEVAALVVERGETGLRYHSAVNPARRLPALLRERTGLTQEMADEAPAFGEIAADLLDAIGDLPIVGHEVNGQVAFLNRELDRLGLPPLVNPRHELIDLATRWLPESGRRKPSLDNLARSAGVPAPTRRNAFRDAQTVLSLCRALEARAAAAGEALFGGTAPAGPESLANPPETPVPPLRDPCVVGRAPESPGVYLMRDADGTVVYVGRSVNLRKRLQSYAAGQLGFTRQLEGLVDAVASVEWEPLDTELATMLVEARRLRQHAPRFNVQRSNAESPLWLKLDRLEPFPRLGLARGPRPDGAEYFGPYRTGSAAARALKWATDTIPLRTCRRRLGPKRNPKLGPCHRLAQGLCPGPCVRDVEPADYEPAIDAARTFLEGDRGPAEAFLRERLTAAAARGDRPAADRLRTQLIRFQRFDPRADLVDDADSPADAIMLHPLVGQRPVAVTVVVGRLPWPSGRLGPETDPDDAAEFLLGAYRHAQAAECPADGTTMLARWWRERPERRTSTVMPVIWPRTTSGWRDLGRMIVGTARQIRVGATTWPDAEGADSPR